MKQKLLLALILALPVAVLSQHKPIIDTAMLGTWPFLSPYDVLLSNDGHYVTYIIQNCPLGQQSLVIQDLRNNWKKTVVANNARPLFFTADNRQLCWQQGDTVWLHQAGGDRSHLLAISGTLSYPMDNKGQWLAILNGETSGLRLVNLLNGQEQFLSGISSHRWLTGGHQLMLTTSNGDLKVMNLLNSKNLSFSGVKDYVISPNEKKILLIKESGQTSSLQWLNNGSSSPITIWTGQAGEKPSGYVFDKPNDQLAFNVEGRDSKIAVWLYRIGQPSAVLKVDENMAGMKNALPVSGVTSFSGDGRWLFFNLRKQLPSLPTQPTTTPVDIWSYRDEIIFPEQSTRMTADRTYAAAIETNSNKVQFIEQSDDEYGSGSVADYVLLRKGGNNVRYGSWWPHSDPASYWLTSLKDGKRILIKNATRNSQNQLLFFNSPRGQWYLYWEPNQRQYHSLDLESGKSINLTEDLGVNFEDDVEQIPYPIPITLAGWYRNDSAVLIYDNYDIWKLDLSGHHPPINLTGGYGKQHGIKLRLISNYRDNFVENEEVLISGYDVKRKHNGFFTIKLDNPKSLQLLTMGPYTYFQATINKQSFTMGMPPISGGEGKNKLWIVMRESASEFPNLYVSKDLRTFTPVTNLQPQTKWNWLTTEVVSWRMYNGQENTGVLYKPENFDSTKQYPIIFNYYEKFSQRCYQFPHPGLTTANINIPWFVSRGYLVFTPDIQFTIATRPGGMTPTEGAYNTVASAAEYLANRPYIDKSSMAIQGHSFAGGLTNGLITRTNLFAAAAEMAGGSDNISGYLSLVSISEQLHAEEKHPKQDHPQNRMDASIWERPDIFLRNSTILNADKINTPLLIVHNKKDGAINFRQGIEMYMAMRRLGKTCWLLQYDSSGHILNSEVEALDYTLRLTQYFDHYLKKMPAPQWMTMNTLAEYKGKNSLYLPDVKGNCSSTCAICNKWNPN